MRSMPPPPSFSLSALPDDVLLTQIEVAAVQRKAVPTVEKGRYDGNDGLQWIYVGGWPRCIAGSLKKVMAGDPTVRRPPVPQEPKQIGALHRVAGGGRAAR